MHVLQKLLDNNRAWAERVGSERPGFLSELATQQKPNYLWIGCSDSRVPASEIVGLPPGEVFVHRNIANVVVHTDLNCLSVLQYAVEVLKVEHVIVCGHYGCGGVQAALNDDRLGLIDNWLRHIRDVYGKHAEKLGAVAEDGKLPALCELNVIEQANNVAQTPIVRAAWDRGQPLTVHGWIYGLEDGLIRDLGICMHGPLDR